MGAARLVPAGPARYNSGVLTCAAILGLSAGWLVAGLSAAALPVVIHLWARRRGVVRMFPAARFVRRAMASRMKRRRLRDGVLLALRAGALAALALAFARPRLEGASLSGAGVGDSVVILLDASASMRRAESGVALFDAAKERCLSMLRGLSPGRDRAAVILVRADPEPILPRLSENFDELVRAVEASSATLERGDANAALIEAGALLADETDPARRVVVVFSDGQATQWRGVAERSRPDAARRFVLVGNGLEAGNVALGEVTCSPASPVVGRPARLSARVRNFSDGARASLVCFTSSGRGIGEALVMVPPWSEANATLDAALDAAGPTSIGAAVSADEFGFDDRGSVEVVVRDAPRYALVPCERDGEEGLSAASFLRAALRASSGAWPASLDVEDATEAALARFSAVAVTDAARLSGARIASLRAFAARGGTVLLFGGKAGLSPEPPGGSVWPMSLEPSASSGAVTIRRAVEDSPAIEDNVFADLLRAWDGVELPSHARTTLLPGAVALLESEDGPMLARRRVGGGAVVMFSAELSPARSEITRAPIFPALVHAMLEGEARRSAGVDARTTGVDPAESDFRLLTDSERAAFETGVAAKGGVIAAARGASVPPVELWPWVMVGALVLLAAEGWLRAPAMVGGGTK